MTPEEFKAWFEGFCEGVDGAPNPHQWQRIKERVGEIVAVPSTPIYYPILPSAPASPWWQNPTVTYCNSYTYG